MLSKKLLISAFSGLLACVALAANDVPVVRTADLSAIVAGAKPAIEITPAKGPLPQPVASVLADNVQWKGDEGKEMTRIAALSPIDIKFNKDTDLRTSLRAICEQAQMKFYIQSDDPVMDSPIILSGTNHPWAFLRNLAQRYKLDIVYQNGIWNIYPLNTSERVFKNYVIKNNTMETFRSASSASSGGISGGASTGGASSGNYTSGGSGGSSLSVDRSGQGVFSMDSKPMVDAIKALFNGSTDSNVMASLDAMPAGKNPSKIQNAAEAAPTVTFDSTNNILTVIGTRSQHALIADWLVNIDQPLKLIHIESKFLLSTVNPRRKYGAHNPLMDGISANWSSFSNTVNPFNVNTWKFPSTILSMSDLNFSLSMLAQESDTQTVQYPQQTTIAGREVVLRSMRQIPISSARNNDTTAGGSRVASQLQYIDVGTVVSILPKVLDNRNIMLNISITVSSIDGTKLIDGNEAPTLNTQTYTNQVIVETGYSLALGGLEQTLRTTTLEKTPILGDIPFFGYLFKNISKDNSRSVLTMIVTPSIMEGYNGGNPSGRGEYTLPQRGLSPRVVFDPRTMQTAENVQISLRGFDNDVVELETIVKEGRAQPDHKTRVAMLVNELDLMEITLDREAAYGRISPVMREDIKGYRSRLVRVNRSIK